MDNYAGSRSNRTEWMAHTRSVGEFDIREAGMSMDGETHERVESGGNDQRTASEKLQTEPATEGVPQWTSPYIKPIHLITDEDSQDVDGEDV